MDGRAEADLIAAVLAGGRARRMGGAKAGVLLAGRPLAAWPVAAARAAGLRPVLVAKPATALPDLGVPVVREPEGRHHPFAGVLAALDHAAGPVVVLGADMPFLSPLLLRAVAGLEGELVVVRAGGMLQPLCARYGPGVRDALAAALEAEAPMRATLEELDPVTIEAAAADVAGVNRPEDLAAAEARLGRSGPSPR